MRLLARVACCLLVSNTAIASIGPVTVDPEVLLEGEVGHVHVTLDQCDVLLTQGARDRRVTLVGSVITVSVAGYHAFDDPLCNYPQVDYVYDLEPLPVGRYIVIMQRSNYFVPSQVDTLGSTTVSVVPVSSIPTGSFSSSIAVALGVLALGWLRQRAARVFSVRGGGA